MEKVDEKIEAINTKLDRVMDYVILMDKVTNREAAAKMNVPWNTFRQWLRKPGFPRLDNEHVSLSQVQKHLADKITKKKQ
jgi:hypothetical protein